MNKKIISKLISGTLLCSMLTYATPAFAYTKDETVYSKADSNGKVYETVVSEHLQNTDKNQVIDDLSDLLNIQNTKGDETFSQDGTKVVWQASGKDIYYQGNTSKELPVTCEIKYELDGQEISANEIKGKTGKVKITINYTNNEKRGDMYVPFVVIVGTIIDNEKATNIEVENGKAIDDGSKTMVMGMAMPGLQESLGLSEDDIDIPSSIEITLDATNFEQKNIITYVTSKVVEKSDLKLFNKIDNLFDKVSDLESASKQLLEGSNALQGGTEQLLVGTTELQNGIKEAYNGSEQIKAGVDSAITNLNNDKSPALDNKTLSQIVAAAKDAVNQELTDDYLEEIGAAAASEASAELTPAYLRGVGSTAATTALGLIDDNNIENTAKAQVTAQLSTLKTKAHDAVIAAGGNEKEAQAAEEAVAEIAVRVAKDSAVTTAHSTAQQVASLTAQNAVQTTTATVADKVAQKVAKQTAEQTVEKTATSVATTVANMVKQVANSKVASQMSTLSDGLGELNSGLSQLNNGASQLKDGTSELNDGATTLAEGMAKFDKEGIHKITDTINGKAKDLLDRVKQLKDLSEEYNSFTMLEEGNTGTVKFIIIADSIKE